MKSYQDMIKETIKKYMDFGYSLQGAVRQAYALHRGMEVTIAQVEKELAK